MRVLRAASITMAQAPPLQAAAAAAAAGGGGGWQGRRLGGAYRCVYGERERGSGRDIAE